MIVAAEQQTEEQPGAQLSYLSFNQTKDRCAISTEKGFKTYDLHPFKERGHHDLATQGEVCLVELCYRSSLAAVVFNQGMELAIWDDQENATVGELKFSSTIFGVRLTNNLLVVMLADSTEVYSFSDLALLKTRETQKIPGSYVVGEGNRLVALCTHHAHRIIALPSRKVGCIEVSFLDVERELSISAHDSSIGCLGIDRDGTRLCSASQKGTLLRVFDTATGRKLCEFRRGAERAMIYSIAFSWSSKYLACTSDKRTIHIFALKYKSGVQITDQNHSRSEKAVASENAGGEAGQGTESRSSEWTDQTLSEDPDEDMSFKNHLTGMSLLRASVTGARNLLVPKFFEDERSFAHLGIDAPKALCAFTAFSLTRETQETGSILDKHSRNMAERLMVLCSNGLLLHIEFDEKRKLCDIMNQYQLFSTQDSSAKEAFEQSS